MNKDNVGILVSMILGDGYLNVRHGKSSALVVVHSIKQIEFARYKYNLLQEILPGKYSFRIYDHVIHKTGKVYPMCGFTCCNSIFADLKKVIYKNNKKFYSHGILSLLTAEGIATWYMDDGHARRNYNKEGFISSCSSEIMTCCDEESANNICDYFNRYYKIEFRIGYEKRSGSYFVKTNTKGSRQFVELIQPYIIPSMKYKITHTNDQERHERRPPKTCKRCNNTFTRDRGLLCDACYNQNKALKKLIGNGDDIVRAFGNNKPKEVEDKELQR